MRRLEFVGVMAAAALSGKAALACGDHLLVVGRGVRFQRAYSGHPGNLLLYSSGSQGATIRNPTLQNTLKQVGHRLQTVEGVSQLDAALKSGKVDIVLADFADLAPITGELRSAPSNPVIVPILFKPSKADLAAAQRDYRFLLKTPADVIQFLATIDEAMKSRVRIVAKT